MVFCALQTTDAGLLSTKGMSLGDIDILGKFVNIIHAVVARISPLSDTCLCFWDEPMVVHTNVRRLGRMPDSDFGDGVQCPYSDGIEDKMVLAHEESSARVQRL